MLFIALCLLFSCDSHTAEEYTVVFDANNGTFNGENSVSIKVIEGTAVSAPENPSRPGYRFQGWCMDAEGNTPFELSTTITSTITLYAKWERLTVVTFNYYGLRDETTEIVGEDYKLPDSSLSAPTGFTGGTFSGWFTESGDPVKAGTDIKADTTLYPKWITDNGYVKYTSDEVSAYLVSTVEGLRAWATATESNKALGCVLLSDISLGQNDWTQIGTSREPYTGTFDGNGHTISNLTMNTANNAGLFSYLGGTVKNLKLTNVNIAATGTSTDGIAGGIAAYCTSNSNIENCSVQGIISASSSNSDTLVYAGGIVGYVQSGPVNITACVSEASVSTSSNNTNNRSVDSGGIGGHLGGSAFPTTVIGCYATGELKGHSTAGIGHLADQIIACYSTAKGEDNTEHYGISSRPSYSPGSGASCYYTNANLGKPTGDDWTTKVEGNVTWETAMNEMNKALENAGVNYRYELNLSADATSLPLVIKPYNP